MVTLLPSMFTPVAAAPEALCAVVALSDSVIFVALLASYDASVSRLLYSRSYTLKSSFIYTCDACCAVSCAALFVLFELFAAPELQAVSVRLPAASENAKHKLSAHAENFFICFCLFFIFITSLGCWVFICARGYVSSACGSPCAPSAPSVRPRRPLASRVQILTVIRAPFSRV